MTPEAVGSMPTAVPGRRGRSGRRAVAWPLAGGLIRPPGAAPAALAQAAPRPDAGAWQEFQGAWTEACHREAMALGGDHRASIADFDESLTFYGASRPALIFPPGVGKTPEAPVAARKELAALGPMSRDERLTAGIFAFMVLGLIFADALRIDVASVAVAGLGLPLMSNVLTLAEIELKGPTLDTLIWLAVPFALSTQLNEMGFMGYAGQRLAALMVGLSWPVMHVVPVAPHVGIHYMFVGQPSQAIALPGVFLDVGSEYFNHSDLYWPWSFATLFFLLVYFLLEPVGCFWLPHYREKGRLQAIGR
jgi:hypothetical protein